MKKQSKKVVASKTGLHKKFRAEHGIAVGILLLLFKGILGITALVGIVVIAASALLYLTRHPKKAK
jgi:hypothetical protein